MSSDLSYCVHPKWKKKRRSRWCIIYKFRGRARIKSRVMRELVSFSVSNANDVFALFDMQIAARVREALMGLFVYSEAPFTSCVNINSLADYV
jgi:hypothetical protein